MKNSNSNLSDEENSVLSRNEASVFMTGIKAFAVVASVGLTAYFGSGAIKRDSDNRHLETRTAHVAAVREALNDEGVREYLRERRDFMDTLIERHTKKDGKYALITDFRVLKGMVDTALGPVPFTSGED